MRLRITKRDDRLPTRGRWRPMAASPVDEDAVTVQDEIASRIEGTKERGHVVDARDGSRRASRRTGVVECDVPGAAADAFRDGYRDIAVVINGHVDRILPLHFRYVLIGGPVYGGASSKMSPPVGVDDVQIALHIRRKSLRPGEASQRSAHAAGPIQFGDKVIIGIGGEGNRQRAARTVLIRSVARSDARPEKIPFACSRRANCLRRYHPSSRYTS